jgi:hypothetical protein
MEGQNQGRSYRAASGAAVLVGRVDGKISILSYKCEFCALKN